MADLKVRPPHISAPSHQIRTLPSVGLPRLYSELVVIYFLQTNDTTIQYPTSEGNEKWKSNELARSRQPRVRPIGLPARCALTRCSRRPSRHLSKVPA